MPSISHELEMQGKKAASKIIGERKSKSFHAIPAAIAAGEGIFHFHPLIFKFSFMIPKTLKQTPYIFVYSLSPTPLLFSNSHFYPLDLKKIYKNYNSLLN